MNSKIHYYRFVKFISSWKVLLSVLIPVLIIDYMFPIKGVSLFYFFLVLYFPIYLVYTYVYYRRGGKKRLDALESGDTGTLEKMEKKDNKRYILILVTLGLTFLYILFNGY